MTNIATLPDRGGVDIGLSVATSNAVTLRIWSDQHFSSGQLLPRDVLDAARGELEAALSARAPEKFADASAARLIGSYPQRGAPLPEFYAANLSAVMRDYPADIVRDAARRLIRSCKFLPAIAEFAEIADGMMAERRKLLAGALRQIRRHDEREAEQREEAERSAQAAEAMKLAQEAVSSHFDDLVAPAEIHGCGVAGFKSFAEPGAFMTWAKVRGGDPIAIEAWRRAIILHRASEAYDAGGLPERAVAQIARALANWREVVALQILSASTASEGRAATRPAPISPETRDAGKAALSAKACAEPQRAPEPTELSDAGREACAAVLSEMAALGCDEALIDAARSDRPADFWNALEGISGEPEMLKALARLLGGIGPLAATGAAA